MSPKQFGVQQFFWFKKVWVKQNFWPNKILIQGLPKNRVQKVWVCNSWDIRNMDKCRQDTCFLFPWQLESVKDGSRYLLLKSGENQISNSWYIPDMDKCHMNKCCMDKCHCDTWNLFKMIQGAYLSSLIKSGNNSWDIADIEFVAVGGGGWCAKSISRQTRLRGGIKIENRENLGQCLNRGGQGGGGGVHFGRFFAHFWRLFLTLGLTKKLTK